MLAGAEDGGPGPSLALSTLLPYVPAGRGAMYLLGASQLGRLRDFWVLNLTTLQWRQEKVSITVPRSPHSQAPAEMASSSSHPCPRGGCFLLGPQHKSKLNFLGRPGSHLIPEPVPQPRDVTLWVARLGHSPLVELSTLSPVQPEVRAGEQGIPRGTPGYSHLKKRHQAGRNSDRSAHLPGPYDWWEGLGSDLFPLAVPRENGEL